MGFLEVDYKNGKHLRVTALGEEVLYGRRRVELAVVQKKEFRVKESKAKVKAGLPLEKQTEDLELMGKLKQLRRDLAEENKWPAYIVMSDKTLHALATEKPVTLEQFGEVFGIGERKKQDFGARFVALIRKHEGLVS